MQTPTLFNHNLVQHTLHNQLYTSIPYRNTRYRLLTNEFKMTSSALTNLCWFWFIILVIEIGVLVSYFWPETKVKSSNIEITIVLISAWVPCILLTVLALKNRKKIIKILLLSLFNLSALLTTLIIMIILQIPSLLIPASVYIVFEICVSIFALKNKANLIPKILILLQLLAIVLKLDHRIESSWTEVLFGFMFVTFISVVIILSMAVFWVVNIYVFAEEVWSIRHIGLCFVILNGLSMGVSAGLHVAIIFFIQSSVVVCILASSVNLGVIYFAKYFRTEIILFLCRVQKISDYGQVIMLRKAPNTEIAEFAFKRKSENWFEKVPINTLLSEKSCHINREAVERTNNDYDSHLESTALQKCLICMELAPCMIWMPCGHLTVCEICCDRMFETKISSCLLCKQTPEAVFVIVPEEEAKEKEKEEYLWGNREEQDTKKGLREMSTTDFEANENSQSSLNENLRHIYGEDVLEIKTAYSVSIV